MISKFRYLKTWVKVSLLSISILLILFVLSLLLSLSALSLSESLRIVFGSVFVLFLPGFIISCIFFSKGEIESIERIALSFALSIAIVPLAIFYLNLIGLKISTFNSIISIFLIILFSLAVLLYKRKKERH